MRCNGWPTTHEHHWHNGDYERLPDTSAQLFAQPNYTTVPGDNYHLFPSQRGSVPRSLLTASSRFPSGSSAGFPRYIANSPPGFTSELASLRGISDPLTPTSSREGDGDLGSDPMLVDKHGLGDADHTLQGITSTAPSCMPYDRSCSSHLALHGDRLHENPHASLQSLGRTQPPGRDYISTTIPARQLTLRDPWTPIKLHYARVSEISDIVDEGPGFEDSVGLRYSHHEAVRSAFLPTRSPQLYCKDGQQGPIDAQQQWQQTWLGNVYVYQDVENGVNGNGDPSASVSTSPTNSADTVISRIGKRKGPLSEPSRLNAKKMRKEVACFRCFIMREKCELDEESGHDGICVRCRELENNLRTWDLLCSREGLDQRGKFLVPTILVLQLEASHVRAFVKEHVQYLVPGSCIKLSLTMGFGEPLRINAVEVFPRGQEAARMLGFRPSETGSTTTTSLDSPPIIPSLTDRVAIDQHINHWLDTLIREPDSELPDYCFPEAHEQWEREMLSIICQYYQALDPDLETQGGSPYHTLALALRLTVLNYIMGHPFVVPDDEVEALTRQLQYHQPDVQADWICPRLANKIIKSMLLGMLKETINQVLDGLQKMLRRNASKEEDRKLWDPAFCIVFLCLIVVGKTQASLLERVEIGSANHDGPFLLHHAISTIEEMEKELSMHLIGMFHHKFGTARKANGKGKPFNPLARAPSDREQDATRLPALILEATGNYGQKIHEAIKREDIGVNEMNGNHVTRLMVKFMKPFLEH